MQIFNPRTQRERVIAICCDGQYRTLEGIQKEIKVRFNQFDSTPAISARLREKSQIFQFGYIKDKYRTVDPKTKKVCYHYTLKKIY